MNKGNTKRGFIPPQPAAAISALDFVATSEALRRAEAAGEDAARTGDWSAVEAAADLVAEMSDRLISIPTSDPARIAEKVAAYAWLNNAGSCLHTPTQQRRIAENGSDAAKGLLAIYLDLAATEPVYAPADAFAIETTTVLEMERQMLASDDDAEAQAWDDRCMAAIKVADALPPAPEHLATKIRGLRLIYENHGGFDQLETETTDCRLLRDIAKTLLAMGIGA